ncbi:MAG: hypothetical protein QXO20_06120 [Candidatus Bathyarchaeia archaeon]
MDTAPVGLAPGKDVTREKIEDKYDVLLMIDVTQHIVKESLFKKALANCREAVLPGGHFIVTSWLRPYQKFSEEEVMRPLSAYLPAFANWTLTGPFPFKDKFIMAFTRPAEDHGKDA